MSLNRQIANLAGQSLATDAELSSGLASKLDLAGGKILQIVRTTNSTTTNTTSTTFVDATNHSVTITPQVDTSRILIIATGQALFRSSVTTSNCNHRGFFIITDSSNVGISGASMSLGSINKALFSVGNNLYDFHALNLVGWATPGVTTAVTYKLRLRSDISSTTTTINYGATGQMYAIEVSA